MPVPFLLMCNAVLILCLLNGRRAVFLPNTVNCLRYAACNSGDEEIITLLGPLILCFNKQEKHIDQKEAVCTYGHKTNSLSRTSENMERAYVILQGSSSRRLLAELTRVFGKKSHLLGD